MREVLFRAQRCDNKEWVEGSLYNSHNGNLFIADGTLDWDGHMTFPKIVQVIPSTVGQYTGLTDKNGKKIFEGDVVKTESDNAYCRTWPYGMREEGQSAAAVVRYNDGGFEPFSIYDSGCGEYNYPRDFEVIGNIHDNPELLKGE